MVRRSRSWNGRGLPEWRLSWKDVFKHIFNDNKMPYILMVIIFILLSILLWFEYSDTTLIRKEDVENCICYEAHPMSGMFKKLIFEPLDCFILKIKCGSMM